MKVYFTICALLLGCKLTFAQAPSTSYTIKNQRVYVHSDEGNLQVEVYTPTILRVTYSAETDGDSSLVLVAKQTKTRLRVKDLGEQFVFEQSLRPFHSNPSTTIPNDQQGFAEFCYGSMVSCKEGNMFACARNLARHTN